MGGRGSSSGMSDSGKKYGTEYTTLYQSGNIKFVRYKNGSATAPVETMTKGRVYVTVNAKELWAGMIECEDNADKGYLRKEISKRGIPVHGYHESMNKFVKISTYLRKNWRRIIWLEDTDPEYINEILDYNEFADHDDSPDSAASLLRHMESRPRLNRNIKGGL